MRDIIIDAETLDTKDTAVIPSIGARLCNLETGEMGEGFHVKLNVQEQIDAGYTISADTLAFWMNQDQAARDYLIAILQNKTPTVSRQVGFSMLHQFISNVKDANAWGNGISFDLGLGIREWGQDNLPWEFWNEQDVRTIVSYGCRVFGVQFKKEVQFEGTQHNPLDDATHEAQYLMAYFAFGKSVNKMAQEYREMQKPSFALDGATVERLRTELEQARERISELERCPQRIFKFDCGNVDGAMVQHLNPGDPIVNIRRLGETTEAELKVSPSDMTKLRQAMQNIDTRMPLLYPGKATQLPTVKMPFPKDSDAMLKAIAGALGVSYDDVVPLRRSAAKDVLRAQWEAYKDRKAELQAEEFDPELLESIADELKAAEKLAIHMEDTRGKIPNIDQKLQEVAAGRDDGVKLEGMTEDPAPAKDAATAKYHSVHFHFADGSDIAEILEDFAETFVNFSKIFSELAAPEDADVIYTSSEYAGDFNTLEPGQTVIFVDQPRPETSYTGSDLYEWDLWDEWHQYSWTGVPAKPDTLPTLYCLIRDASDEVIAAMWGVHRIKAARNVRDLHDDNDSPMAPVAMLYKKGSKVPLALRGDLEAKNIRLISWDDNDMECDDLPNTRLRERVTGKAGKKVSKQ